MSSPRRRLTALGATVMLVLVTAPAPSPAAAQLLPPPNSIASLGDSITQGFNACGFYLSCASQSFSTGSTIDSHYRRIREINPAIAGNRANYARCGAQIQELPDQAREAVAGEADYVTILIGANDVCAGSEDLMTPVPEFRRHLDDALAVLRSGTPAAWVLILSIPDLTQLWEAGRSSRLARFVWTLLDTCPSLLANSASLAPADVARRDRVRQRIIDYNAELAAACAAYGPNCRFDGGAVFQHPFSLAQISGWDFFHPNRAGQAILAEVSYQAGFNWQPCPR